MWNEDYVNELTERQRTILSIAVQEYIREARPVGSRMIRQRYGLRVSPATIRNEFMALADMGYLAQPHTSAGRVPTADGYRFFVEQLMEESELPMSQQLRIRHQFHQITDDPDQWMKLAASVLAHVSQSASVIAAPQAELTRFRRMELISISELTGLMILVLQDGAVHQQMMVFARAVAQEELSGLAAKLNAAFAELAPDENRAKVEAQLGPETDPLETEITQRLLQLIKEHERKGDREIYRDGLMHILQQPEFDEIARARQIVQILEEDRALEAIFSEAELTNGVQVIIGSEGKWEGIRDCSMVLSGYGLPGEAKGVLGVLGPMRMPYGRAIPAVRYVARMMSDLLCRLYGE